jgi:mitogen-activated protein kinase kinase kinase
MNGPRRVSSPDDQFVSASNRARSSSINNQKVLLQATVDNEQFAVVDITGTQSADGIREKMLSRVSSSIPVVRR